MRRRDLSLTVALSASLLAHGGIIIWGARQYTQQQLALLGRFRWVIRPPVSAAEGGVLPTELPPPLVLQRLPDPPRRPEPDKFLEPPPPPLLPPQQRPKPKPPPPPPTPDLEVMGDHVGGGEATARNEGDKPQEAREGSNDQAALGRLPEGARQSGEGGTGAPPSAPAASPQPPQAPPEQGSKTEPAPPRPPAPSITDPTAGLGENRQGSDDGLLKRAQAAPSETQGRETVGPKSPQHLPSTPKVAPRPLPPAVQQRMKSQPDVREAPDRRDSQGKSTEPDAQASPQARPDPAGQPSPPDDRPTSEKPDDRTAPGSNATEGGRQAQPDPDATGKQPPPQPQGDTRQRQDARENSASADSTAPKGDPAGSDPANQPGTPDPTADPTDKPGTAPDTAKTAPTPPGEKSQPEPPQARPTPPNANPDDAAPAGDAAAARATPHPETPAPPQPTPAAKPAPQVPPSNPSQPSPTNGNGRAPGNPAPPGDLCQQSDSESDPFSKRGYAVLTRGKLEAKFGRQKRTVRPRFTLAGQIDLATKARPRVTAAVSTDETGKVINVEVLESSGAPDTVDLPIVRALYEWWIEPPKDAKGNPKPDTIVWQIVIR